MKPSLYEYRIDSAWCIECQIGRMRLKVSRALTFIGFHFSLECRVLHWSLFNQQISTVITWWPIFWYFVKLGKKYGYYLMPDFPITHINLTKARFLLYVRFTGFPFQSGKKSTVVTWCRIFWYTLKFWKKLFPLYHTSFYGIP